MKKINSYIIEKLKLNKNSKPDKVTPFIEKLIEFLYMDNKNENHKEAIDGFVNVFNEYVFNKYTIEVEEHDAKDNVNKNVFNFKTYIYQSTKFLWWTNAELLFKSSGSDVTIKKAKNNIIGIKSYKTLYPVLIKYEEDK